MNRLMMAISLATVLAVASFTSAKNSEGSGSSGGGVHGKIQSISNTLLSVGIGHGHHHRLLKAVVVHYNPDSTTVTLDGVPVSILDVSAIGKYVSITGTMHDNQLEATSITVSSTPPSHPKKSKSKST